MPLHLTTDHPEIPLARMPQQEGVWVPKDDWTGTIDRTERRKLQNRLSQRAYRSRKKLDQQLNDWPSLDKQSAVIIPQRPSNHDDEFTCSRAPSGIFDLMHRFESMALSNYERNSPNVDHLISVSRFNIQRAIIDNTRAMGMTMKSLQPDDAISIFNLSQPNLMNPIPEAAIPPSLRPTMRQREIPHHPWLDFFPFPNLRDNLISAQDEIDDDDLCHDLMAFWDTRNTGATLLVWGPSWEPTSWEVTPAFLEKWGFLLRGCGDILRSTNQWRVKRGERPIIWHSIEKPGS
ncbi:Protein of unknown function DUF3425 [Penicillium angulare]|uniref:Protein of unknown function DUF3425 n=1 Tax=Penicillium angulare TaxID=116970 RepID=UPI00254190FB|nr:Protein of unknown function DUF3425 [Penicillium angulare]KAJ5279511.1 Protein of unknown function DUF3425 [Penicillium angulare]